MLSNIGGQGSFCDHIHRAVYEVLQILLEPHEIQQRTPFFEGHEQIQIAAFVAFTPGKGAEDAHVPGAMARRQVEDLCAVFPKDRSAHLGSV